MPRHPWSSTPEELELPSGLTVKVRPVRMQTLIRIGVFDQQMIDKFEQDEDPAVSMLVMAEVAARALVEPRVTLDPGQVDEAEGVFHVDSMPDGDLAAVFEFTQGGDQASFRAEPAGDGAGAGGALLGREAE